MVLQGAVGSFDAEVMGEEDGMERMFDLVISLITIKKKVPLRGELEECHSLEREYWNDDCQL